MTRRESEPKFPRTMKSFIFVALLVIGVPGPVFGAAGTNAISPVKPSSTATNSTFQSGIRGQVMAGPISPVERLGHPNTRPLPSAVITVQSEGSSKEIARQKADDQGRFTVALPKGSYLLVPLPPRPGSSRPHGSPQSVKVESNKFTEVTVHYDTGIR